MAILSVLEYPDKRLRNQASPVAEVTPELRKFIDNLFETMYHENAVGLAATQVNSKQRIIVMDCSDTRDEPICIINPEIIRTEGMQNEVEGCVSLPNLFDKVKRPFKLLVRGLDKDAHPFEMTAEGLLATCVHHETEHLDGTLFIDHLSTLKKNRLLRKLEKNRLRDGVSSKGLTC